MSVQGFREFAFSSLGVYGFGEVGAQGFEGL